MSLKSMLARSQELEPIAFSKLDKHDLSATDDNSFPSQIAVKKGIRNTEAKQSKSKIDFTKYQNLVAS